MAPQLQINQGPQDALLFDNTRSYFTNVGYARTSNFQMELRDVDPQNAANLGGTVNFVIPKAADLLGPVDLMIEFAKANQTPVGNSGAGYWGWVESVGLAMIEKITFSVGSHDVETLTGEHLNIMNELMRSDTNRYGFHQTLKTGRPLVRSDMGAHTAAGTTSGAAHTEETFFWDEGTSAETHDRLIAYGSTAKDGKKLIVPLGLFFTTHPSKYFPLAAIAGCNDVRIAIKFRTLNELIMAHGGFTSIKSNIDADVANVDAKLDKIAFENGSAFASKGCYLRCHYIHVTGPEATALMNREHVRLMKLWHGNEVSKQFTITCGPTATPSARTLDLDLSFLHPVQELVITIRKVSEMGSDVTTTRTVGANTTTKAYGDTPNTAMTKNYFAYHGGGKDPNIESWPNCVEESNGRQTDSAGTPSEAAKPTYLKTTTFQLKLNGQSRHLDGQGIDRNYLMNRLMPMLHSNTCDQYSQISETSVERGAGFQYLGGGSVILPQANSDWDMLSQLKDRKEIYVYPFCLNPEGANPSGSVNFSKVSHAKLSIGVEGICDSLSGTNTTTDEFIVDVYGVYYNWLAIKDGRALTSFA